MLEYLGKVIGAGVLTESPATVTKIIKEATTVLPDYLPTNVPMYKARVVATSQDSVTDGERNIVLSLVATASIADVHTWYRDARTESGQAVTDGTVVGGHVSLKGENSNTAIFVQAANHTELEQVMIT